MALNKIIKDTTAQSIKEKLTNIKTTIENLPSNVVKLNDLSDVDTTGATNGKVLKYNGSKWIPGEGGSTTINWSDITNKPTTLSGYGITNAYTKTEIDNKLNSDIITVTFTNGETIQYKLIKN